MTLHTPHTDTAAHARELAKVTRLRPRNAAAREALADRLRAVTPGNDTDDATPVDIFSGGALA